MSTGATSADDCSICSIPTYEQTDGSTWCPVPMIYLEVWYDIIEEGDTLIVTEGTYTESKMGDVYYGIKKSIKLECLLGDECVVDGQGNHRCLNIMSLNGAGVIVTIKRIKLINGNAGGDFNDVSAESK